MALVRKDTVVQFRVPGELLEDFKYWCEVKKRRTISEELRGYMEFHVDKAREAGLLPDRSVSLAQAVAVEPPVQRQAETVVVEPPRQPQAKVPLMIDEDGDFENRKVRRERERRERKGR